MNGKSSDAAGCGLGIACLDKRVMCCSTSCTPQPSPLREGTGPNPSDASRLRQRPLRQWHRHKGLLLRERRGGGGR